MLPLQLRQLLPQQLHHLLHLTSLLRLRLNPQIKLRRHFRVDLHQVLLLHLQVLNLALQELAFGGGHGGAGGDARGEHADHVVFLPVGDAEMQDFGILGRELVPQEADFGGGAERGGCVGGPGDVNYGAAYFAFGGS